MKLIPLSILTITAGILALMGQASMQIYRQAQDTGRYFGAYTVCQEHLDNKWRHRHARHHRAAP